MSFVNLEKIELRSSVLTKFCSGDGVGGFGGENCVVGMGSDVGRPEVVESVGSAL